MNSRTFVILCIVLVLSSPVRSDEPKKDTPSPDSKQEDAKNRLTVEDGAELFSVLGIQKAQDLAGAKAKPTQQMMILTVKSLPEQKKADYAKAKNKVDFYQLWCKDEAAKRKFKGLLLLICIDPPQVQILASKSFSQEVAKKSVDQMVGGIQAGLKLESAELRIAAHDKGLLEAVQSIKEGLDEKK